MRSSILSTATTSSSNTASIHNSEDPYPSEQVLNPTFDEDSDLGEWSWVTPTDPNVPDTDLDNWENFDWYEGLARSDFESDYHDYSDPFIRSFDCISCANFNLEQLYPDPTFAIQDARIIAHRNRRWRKHLEKYGRTNLGSRAAPRPIPYSIALQTPNSSLVPEIESWAHTAFKDKFNYLIHPQNQPKKPTIQSEKRRVYAMGKVAMCLVISDRCTCYECRHRRSDLQKIKLQDFKEEFEEETREAKWREWEELERQRGGIAWWEELHEGEEEEEESDVARPELVSFVWSGGNNVQRPSEWAKLVDDAVNVWECKRKTAVEQMGWEVCSHGGDGGDGDDDCDCDGDDGILTPRARDQTTPTPLEGKE